MSDSQTAAIDLLELNGLTKVFPGVRANDDVSFTIAPGEIHALLGENGAGKSTLVKMIYGLMQPDAGTMTLLGQRFAPGDPREARAAGIAMVFQHFSLFDALTVAENIALGMEDPPKMRDLSRRISEVSQSYRLPLDPGKQVGALSAGERQRVEIIRCLLQNPRLLIMDEPTSVLTPQEVEVLFATLRRLSDEGTSILYISHKLEEIRSLCHSATILRGGRVVSTADPKTTTARALAEAMVGSALTPPERPKRDFGAPLLEARNLNTQPEHSFGTGLRGVSFTLHAGEILGIGGVAGNGQEEFLAALSGERRAAPRQIFLEGQDIGHEGPRDRRGHGLGLLAAPEERLGHAAVPSMSLADNTLLTAPARMPLAKGGWIDRRATHDLTRRIMDYFDVRATGPEAEAASLSGGNLQKFVIGREVLQAPRVLVVNQPTWGVDAAAATAIRQALINLAASGAGVIVISQDLDELLEMSDTFAALNEGRLSATCPAAGLTIEAIGLMLGGADASHEAAQ